MEYWSVGCKSGKKSGLYFVTIPDDRERCPQCDSDLTCFRVLETLLEPEAQTAEPALPETNPQMTKTANKRTSFFFAVSGLLLGALTIMLGLQVYWITDLQSGVLEQQSVFSDAFSRMGFRLDRISEHQEKVFMQAAAQIENLRDKLDREQKTAVLTAGLADDSDTVRICRKEAETLKGRELIKQARKAEKKGNHSGGGAGHARKKILRPGTGEPQKMLLDPVSGAAQEFLHCIDILPLRDRFAVKRPDGLDRPDISGLARLSMFDGEL